MPLATSLRRRPTLAFGRGRLARALGGLWMAVFLLVAAAAPVVDGLFGHTDEVVAHWEAEGGGHCPPVHTTDDCQICQTLLAARAVVSAPVCVSDPVAGRAPREAKDVRSAPQLALLEPHAPRGPPRA